MSSAAMPAAPHPVLLDPMRWPTEDQLMQFAKRMFPSHEWLWQANVLVPVLSYAVFMALTLVSHWMCSAFPSYRRTPDKLEWNTRVVSNVHAVAQSFFTIVISIKHSYIFTDLLRSSFPAQIVIGISLGYFFSDLTMVLLGHRQMSSVGTTVAHHVIAIASFGAVSYVGHGEAYPFMFLITEISTPFVNLRWFMHKSGHDGSVLYVLAGALMTVAFFVARIVFMPVQALFVVYNLPTVYEHAGGVVSLVTVIGGVGTWALNVVWFRLMLHGLLKKWRELRTPRTTTSEAPATATLTTKATAAGSAAPAVAAHHAHAAKRRRAASIEA